MDDIFVRQDLLHKYDVDEQKVKDFTDVYSFNPPSLEKQQNKVEL